MNNTAPYGNDKASYPVIIKPDSSSNTKLTIQNAVSGQVITQDMVFGLYDYDDQLMKLNSHSQLQISSLSSDSSILGITNKILKTGIADFKGIIFTGIPGSSGYQYKMKTAVIDAQNYKKVYNQDYEPLKITANFRK
jgi:hypothetical protein